VVLPVILISINTFTQMLAEDEHADLARQAVLERQENIIDWPAVCATLGSAGDEEALAAVRRLVEFLPASMSEAIVTAAESDEFNPKLQAEVRTAICELVASGSLADDDAFTSLKLSNSAKKLLDRGVDRLSPEETAVLNWYLLEATFPEHVRKSRLRSAADVTALLGNPNFALLLSAAIAMIVLVWQRGLSLRELAKTTETALMSGGVIILITAGGGAFGGMLRQCGVKESIEGMVGTGDQNVGMLMLLLGFAIATVMKIAQGSGTVSMITTSAIMASMGVSSAMLGCNVVYLAAAIGAGSLCGSWMNDSGFWIFARMGGLTEVEALKTWTILLSILGVTALGFTLLAAWQFPLLPSV
jgi:H+/gluconate symporter-like permease